MAVSESKCAESEYLVEEGKDVLPMPLQQEFEDTMKMPTFESPSLVSGFTYVDLMPMHKEDRFSVLVEQANSWLNDHPTWELKTCESVEFRRGSEPFHFTQFEKMTYHDEDVTTWTKYVRGIRLWVVERPVMAQVRPQSFGYFNIIPQIKNTVCGKPHFESLDTIMQRFNQVMQETPLEGKIITVETVRIKFSPFCRIIDPDRLVYRDQGYNLFILRIFYEKSDPTNEILGIEDFKPYCLQEHAPPFGHPNFEDFTSVIRKVQEWCSRRQSHVRVCNCQTLHIKLKNGDVDEQRMFYTEHKNTASITNYSKIIRVAYMYPANETLTYPEQKPIRICCRTFLPKQKSTRGFFSPPNFESMSQTRDRIAIWILKNNVRVLSAETCAVRMYSGGERFAGPDATHTFSKIGEVEHWIYVFRLFLDGHYSGVPPEMDRSAFQAWNQDPLVVTPQYQEKNSDELCVLQ